MKQDLVPPMRPRRSYGLPQRLMLLGLLLLASAPLAQAQVVIRERVEIAPPDTVLLERNRATRTGDQHRFQSTQQASLVAPHDGQLKLFYKAAQFFGEALDTDALLEITRQTDTTVVQQTDSITQHFQDPMVLLAAEVPSCHQEVWFYGVGPFTYRANRRGNSQASSNGNSASINVNSRFPNNILLDEAAYNCNEQQNLRSGHLWVGASAIPSFLGDGPVAARSFLRYELGEVEDVDSLIALEQARLHLEAVPDAAWQQGDNAFLIYEVATAWDRRATTWDTQPGVTNMSVLLESGVGDYDVDVTAFVQRWLDDPSSNHGFRLSSASEFTSACALQTFMVIDTDHPDFPERPTYLELAFSREDTALASVSAVDLVKEGEEITFAYLDASRSLDLVSQRVDSMEVEGAMRQGQVLTFEAAAAAGCAAHQKDQLEVFAFVEEIELDFLRQDDVAFPRAGDEATVMVSKFRTDTNLDGSVNFASPFSGPDADPDTFRPQVTGLEAGRDVKFRVEVLRNGVVQYDEVFESVSGALSGGDLAYRGDQHLRLVSNAQPVSAPASATYDDDFRGRQTIRAELEDVVRVTLQLDGNDTFIERELPVGRPASEDGRKAVRRAELNWMTYEGLASAPEVITERMSEDWAQAGSYFKKMGEGTFGEITNVLLIQFGRGGLFGIGGPLTTAPTDDTLRVKITLESGASADIEADYTAGDNISQVASKLFFKILQTFPNIDVEIAGAESDLGGRRIKRADDKIYLVVDVGKKVSFENFSGGKKVKLKRAEINLNKLEAHDQNVVAMNVRDDNDQTLDVIVVPNGSMRRTELGGKIIDVQGRAFDDRDTSTRLKNTVFLVKQAADANDDFPNVAGHEAGHVLLVGDFPGSDPDPNNRSHSLNMENLMYRIAPTVETLTSAKRLTEGQHDEARCESAPATDTLTCPGPRDTTNPVLLQKKSKADQ